MSDEQESPRAELSFLPSLSGDGYGYGGGAVITFDGVALIVGESRKAHRIAAHIKDAINAYGPMEPEDEIAF